MDNIFTPYDFHLGIPSDLAIDDQASCDRTDFGNTEYSFNLCPA